MKSTKGELNFGGIIRGAVDMYFKHLVSPGRQQDQQQLLAKRQKVVELDFEKTAVVTRERRQTKSPLRFLQAEDAAKDIDAPDTAPQEIDCSVGNLKVTGVSFVLGLEATEMRNLHPDCRSQRLEEERLKLLSDLNQNPNAPVVDKSMELNQQTDGGSTQRRKRGRPRKRVNTNSTPTAEAGLEDHGTVDVPSDVTVSEEAANEIEPQAQTTTYPADCITGEVDMTISGVPNSVDDDQPLSTWFGGMHNTGVDELRSSSGKSANGSTERGEAHGDIAVKSSAINANANTLPDDHQSLPFVKHSPVWETIESMEPFKSVPQRPHFRPLAECKEEYREGSAIGIMVTFAGLFEKISSLQFDDSRSTLESILGSLLDLESHGFDVTVPRGRVNELMSIKVGQVELLNESNNAERQLKEHTDERSNLSGKIEDIERRIAGLQEELNASKSKMEAKELDFARLQAHADAAKGRLQSSPADFREIATAPWKLP